MATDWNAVDVRILWGERTRCEPHWRLGRRSHDTVSVRQKYSIWFVWAGRGTLDLRHHHVLLRAGICLWMRPGGHYIVEQDANDRIGVTAVHFDLVDRTGQQVQPDDRFPSEVHDLPDIMLADAVLRRVVELVGAPDKPHYKTGDTPETGTARLLLAGLLHDIDARSDQLDYLQRDAPTRRRQHEMLRLAALIRENSGNAPSVKELAEQVGYTPDHFGRVFESVLGVSPQSYAVQVRIDRARQLLLSTDLTVNEVAAALGYQDVFFFSRQFKQKVGVPPSHYRRHAAELSLRLPAE